MLVGARSLCHPEVCSGHQEREYRSTQDRWTIQQRCHSASSVPMEWRAAKRAGCRMKEWCTGDEDARDVDVCSRWAQGRKETASQQRSGLDGHSRAARSSSILRSGGRRSERGAAGGVVYRS